MKYKKLALKSFACVVGTFGIVSGLFYFMSSLISGEHKINPNLGRDFAVEFLRTKPLSELEEKKRKKPIKKPKQLKPPPMKQMYSSPPKTQNTRALKMNMPDIKASLRGDGPSVGGFGAGGVGGGQMLTPIVRVQPQYPQKAARSAIEGWVLLEYTVTPSGTVENVKVLDSKPPRIFDKSAVRAVMKWRFKPQMADGKPIAVPNQKNVIEFSLDKNN